MAKNIEFKGLLNTVPYFLCGGMCGNCRENMWVDSGDLRWVGCELIREWDIRGNGDKMGID